MKVPSSSTVSFIKAVHVPLILSRSFRQQHWPSSTFTFKSTSTAIIRRFSSSSSSTQQPKQPKKSQPVVELREYNVNPGRFASYTKATHDTAQLRQSISPLCFFSFPETGGELLKATHAYYYQGGLQERDRVQAQMAEHSEWNAYLNTVFPYLDQVKSTLFVEAPFLVTSSSKQRAFQEQEEQQVMGLQNVWSNLQQQQQQEQQQQNQGDQNNNAHAHTNNKCILELRRYHLKLGYDTVPKFLEYYATGLPSKLAAKGTDPTTSLVTVMYTEVGRLNEVIELWRHGNGTAAMEQSRIAARGAQEWRQAIAKIADLAVEFHTTIHKPTEFSPLK